MTALSVECKVSVVMITKVPGHDVQSVIIECESVHWSCRHYVQKSSMTWSTMG